MVRHITGSILLNDIIVNNLSNKLLSKFGSFTDTAIKAISILAMGGLIREFFLGNISSR